MVSQDPNIPLLALSGVMSLDVTAWRFLRVAGRREPAVEACRGDVTVMP